jgi:hypothetical protein
MNLQTDSERLVAASSRCVAVHTWYRLLLTVTNLYWYYFFIFLLFSVGWDWVSWYCGHYWPTVQPQMIGDGDCGEIGGIKSGRGNRSTRRKPAPAPLCSPEIPHDWTPGSKSGRRGGKPVTNRFSYGVAFILHGRNRIGLHILYCLYIRMYEVHDSVWLQEGFGLVIGVTDRNYK